MSVLLATDTIELYPPGEQLDGHGWAEPTGEPYWRGRGSLQLAPALTDPRAAEAGGRGPHDPATSPSGLLFLPPEIELRDGCSARTRGRMWSISQVRLVVDPEDVAGYLTCWSATATGWPDDG